MEGISLGTIYARATLDASGMTAGVAQVKAALQGLGSQVASATSATKANTEAIAENLRATINNRDRQREQRQDIKNTEKAVRDLSSALKEQIQIASANSLAKGTESVKAYDRSLKEAESESRRFASSLKEQMQTDYANKVSRGTSAMSAYDKSLRDAEVAGHKYAQGVKERMEIEVAEEATVRRLEKAQAAVYAQNAKESKAIITSGPQSRRDAEKAIAAQQATTAKIMTGMAQSSAQPLRITGGTTNPLESMYGLHTMSSTLGMIGAQFSRVGDAGVAMLTGLVKKGADFNQTLLMLRNNTVMTDKEFADMTVQTKSLGVETGAAMDQIAMGARHIRDYGFTGKAAMEQLSVATKAAVATQTDAGDTAQLLSRVMRVFNIDGSKASGVMNSLWFAAANSNLMMKNLVDTSGRAFAMAGPMGIKFEEVAGALSVFAHQGLNGSQAATQLINDLKKLHAPTKQTSDYLAFLATKAGPDLRAAFTTGGLMANQISGSFQLIAEKAHAAGIPLAEMLTHLFPGLRGETGALIGTTGQGLAGMKDSLKQIADMLEGRTAPLTQRYTDAQKMLNVQLDRLNNSWTVMASVIAERLVPKLIPLINYARDAATWFGKLPPYVQNGTLAMVAMGAIALTLGGRLLTLVGVIFQIRAAMIAMAASGVTTIGVLAGIAAGLARIALLIPKPVGPNTPLLRRQVLESLPPETRAKIERAEAAEAKPATGTVGPAIPGIDPHLMVGNPPDEFKSWLEQQKKTSAEARKAASQAIRDAKVHAAALKDLRLDMARATGDKETYSFAKALEEFYEGKTKGLTLEQRTTRFRAQVERAVADAKKVKDKVIKKDLALDKRLSVQAEEMRAQGPEFTQGIFGGILRILGYTGDDKAAGELMRQRLKETEEFMERVKALAEDRKNVQKVLNEVRTPNVGGLMSQGFAMLSVTSSLQNRSRGAIDFDTVNSDMKRLADVRTQVSSDMFASIMEQMSKVYAFDYDQEQLAGENYLRFLNYKLSMTQRYSDEYQAIQKQISKVEDDLNKDDGKQKKEKVEKGFNVWRDAARRMKGDFAHIFSSMFEDLFSGHKDYFKSFLKAFREMLIKMAAELAASSIMHSLSGLFGGGGKQKGGGSSFSAMFGLAASAVPGGNVIGSVIGGIGGLLGFAEGGIVPGPAGMPRLATVHGGEFVVSNRMQQQGSVGGNVHIGSVHVSSDYDVDRLFDRLAWNAKNRLAVNPGTA